ncbi:hypothetical protein BROUX41_005262 [Berkeleyomyces rouxiae]|uniref:uncharacterized protein n=1 Tax=Berkeleyomyces rouxiae TaxID=2035830 RepID=UPI003B8088C1
MDTPASMSSPVSPGTPWLGSALVAVSAAMWMLALTCSALRCITRQRRARQVEWDEYVVFWSMIFAGAGLFMTTLSGLSADSDPVAALHLRYAARPCLAISCALAQTSACLQLRSASHTPVPASTRFSTPTYLPAPPPSLHRHVFTSTLTLLLCATAALVLTTSFQCQPLSALWNTRAAASCIPAAAQTGVPAGYAVLSGSVFALLCVHAARAVPVGGSGGRRGLAVVAAVVLGACVVVQGVGVREALVVGARPEMGDEVLVEMMVDVVIANLAITAAHLLAAASSQALPYTATRGVTAPSLSRKLASCLSLAVSERHHHFGGRVAAESRAPTPDSVTSYGSDGIVKTVSVRVTEEQVICRVGCECGCSAGRKLTDQSVGYEWVDIIRGEDVT